jgi:hypothetical protein
MLLARPLDSELPPQVEAGWPSREDGAVTALRALIFASIDFFEIVDRAVLSLKDAGSLPF